MDPEQIADLTRGGKVLLVHPDLPYADPTPFHAESVAYWLGRGWEKWEQPAPVKPTVKTASAKAKAAEAKAAESKD